MPSFCGHPTATKVAGERHDLRRVARRALRVGLDELRDLLVHRLFVLDPDKRAGSAEALQDAFFAKQKKKKKRKADRSHSHSRSASRSTVR